MPGSELAAISSPKHGSPLLEEEPPGGVSVFPQVFVDTTLQTTTNSALVEGRKDSLHSIALLSVAPQKLEFRSKEEGRAEGLFTPSVRDGLMARVGAKGSGKRNPIKGKPD